jgi:ABC-type sugar transport system permease subunit
MKEGWMHNLLDTKGRKKSRTASIVFLAIFVATLTLSIILGVVFPRSKRIKEMDDTRFTSVFYAEADEWFYSTEQNIVRLDTDNEITETFSLVEKARQSGINVGQIKDTYASPEGEYMWAITSDAASENKGFIFKLQDADGKLTILETIAFEGMYYQKVLEDDGYLYVFTKPDSFTTILKYDVENISQGAVERGALYKGWEDRNSMVLERASDITILSVDVIDGCLYVLHTGGLIRMSTDFEQNGYKFTYWEKQREIYADLFAEAQENLGEGETLDEEALRSEANTQACAALGIKAYTEGSDKVEILLKDFDSSKYGYYIGDKFCGGAYVKELSQYYVLTTDTNLYSYDIAYLNADLPMNTYLECDVVQGVKLYAKPETEYAALFYNPYTCKGYVVYDSLSEISCINFNGGVSLEYTIEAEFDINRITQIGDNLYYFYFNRFQTERAGQTVLTVVNIEKQLQYPLMLTLLIVSIILCIFSGLMSLLFVLCWQKDGEAEKVRSLLKRIVKNKWVYVSMIPSVILLFAFCYYPAIESIRLSFFEYSTESPTMRWNNFENYKLIFTNQYTGEMFGNMFLFLVADIVTALAPPLVFAFFLTVMRNKGYSQLVRTLLFIPGVIPGIAGMLIWREGIFSNSGGVLHMLLSLFTDDPHMFLTYPTTTRFEMLLIGFPYVGAYLIFYGGMMNISDSYYEAAELEGIGIWKRFFSIDLPLILPQIKYIFITNFIHSVQNFTRVDSVTDGLQGTMTPIKMIYDKINESGAYGEASAYATLMFVFLFFATAINLRKKKQEVEV